MTWTPDKQNRLTELVDKEVNGGGLLLAESRECPPLERGQIVSRALAIARERFLNDWINDALTVKS